jgi:hypothetical protein
VLLTVAPLPLTFWVLIVTTAVVVVLLLLVVARHLEAARADRLRVRVRSELEPVFSRFLETEDPVRLGEELRPAFLRMDAAERPVAAVLVISLMRESTSPSQTRKLRSMLEDSGIEELAERGTRRRSPWRRALACELLANIGSCRSVPALLERLRDRRPEVRIRPSGRSARSGRTRPSPPSRRPSSSAAWLRPNIINNALRRIGGEAATVFARGIASHDPIVRISSCFGLAGTVGTEDRGAATLRLAGCLASDTDVRVRAAAAACLGNVGGDDVPAALVDAAAAPDVNVRRAAVRALGSFDDPTVVDRLVESAEDDDRETAIRAAEALLALARRPRAPRRARCPTPRRHGRSTTRARLQR